MTNCTRWENIRDGQSTLTRSTPNTLNQLVAVSSSVDGGTKQNSGLSYDASGNLTQTTAADGSKTLYTYDDGDRLTHIESRTAADAPRSRSEFTYDFASRKVVSKEFTYTNGAWSKTAETRRVFDGLDVIQERNDANEATASYVRDGNIGGILARTSQSGHSYFHYDGGGNVTALSDENGALVGRYSYDAFGNTLEASGPRAAENPYRFSTKEWHAASGMVDYGYRFYSPGMGRWLNRDPIRESGGVNLYGFVGNNPVNYVDTDGLRPINNQDLKRLHSLPYGGKLTGPTNAAIRAIKAAIAAVPNGSADPANLRAAFWAIDNLGNTSYGNAGVSSNGMTSDIPAGKPKCNIFVADAYAIGAGLGYGGGAGVPANRTGLGGTFGAGGWYPYVANALGTASTNIPRFPVTTSPKVGDIAAFAAPGGIGHATLNLGGGLLIYASNAGVKVGTMQANQSGHSPVVYRTYKP